MGETYFQEFGPSVDDFPSTATVDGKYFRSDLARHGMPKYGMARGTMTWHGMARGHPAHNNRGACPGGHAVNSRQTAFFHNKLRRFMTEAVYFKTASFHDGR